MPRASERVLRERRGSALILVLIMTLSLAGLAISAIYLSSSANLLTRYYDKERNYRYGAEMAIALGKSRVNRDTTLALPDTGMLQILTGASLSDAAGVTIPNVKVNLYGAYTGDTSGRFGKFVTLVAQAYDTGGTRMVRRLDLTSESFSRFAMFADSFPSGLVYGTGEFIRGRAHSNNNWYSQSSAPGPTYYDTVSATGSVNGTATYTFGFLTGVPKIAFPTVTKLAALPGYATAGNLNFAPVSGTQRWDSVSNGTSYDLSGQVTAKAVSLVARATRVRFKPVDVDLSGTIEESEGFMEVFDIAAGIDTGSLRVDLPETAPTPVTNIVMLNQCGILATDSTTIAGLPTKEFFPVARIHEPWILHRLRTKMSSPALSAADSTTMAPGLLTGTVTTNGTTTVTGVGTLFTTQLAVNDSITIGTGTYKISAIGSATSLTLSSTAAALSTVRAVDVTKMKAGQAAAYSKALDYGVGISRCFPPGSSYLMLSERNVDSTTACAVLTPSVAYALTTRHAFGYGASGTACPLATQTAQQYGGQDTTFTPNSYRCFYDPGSILGRCLIPTVTPAEVLLGAWRQFGGTQMSGLPATKIQLVEGPYLWPIYKPYNLNAKGVIYSSGRLYASDTLRGNITLYALGTVVFIDDLVYDMDPSGPTALCRNFLGIIARDSVMIADNALNRPRPDPSSNWEFFGFPNATLHMITMSLTATVGVENPTGTQATSPAIQCQGNSQSGGCLNQTGGVIEKFLSATYGSGSSGLRENRTVDPCQLTNHKPPFFPQTGRYLDDKYYEIDPTQVVTLSQVANFYAKLRGKSHP
jgi:hypothetical protein